MILVSNFQSPIIPTVIATQLTLAQVTWWLTLGFGALLVLVILVGAYFRVCRHVLEVSSPLRTHAHSDTAHTHAAHTHAHSDTYTKHALSRT